MSDVIIEARQLHKRFGSFSAVDGLDLTVRRGGCFGLLGPNGAGKSTFIGMTYGTVRRTGGELKVFGIDPSRNSRDIKKRLGVVTQDNALDESLSVRENMLIYTTFLGLPNEGREKRVDELLEYMQLQHKAEMPIRALSGGMKRRLVFVRALLGNPEVLILDEPTTGLDPAVRHLLWGKVKELRAKGVTILLTTHYMHEAEILCDRLVIMNKGKIIGEGSPTELIRTHCPGYVGVFQGDKLVTKPTLDDLLSFQKESGEQAVQLRPSNLEDVFLKLTGEGLSSDA